MAITSPQSPNPPESTPPQTKQSKLLNGAMILKEDVDPTDFKTSQLTTDCYYVYRTDNQIYLVRGVMVKIFDQYYDKGVILSRIALANGSRNPKNSQPEI